MGWHLSIVILAIVFIVSSHGGLTRTLMGSTGTTTTQVHPRKVVAERAGWLLPGHPALARLEDLPARPWPDHSHRLTFALKQSNLDRLDDLFWDVSNPSSSRYAQYLSLEELNKLVGPSEKTVSTVVNWLRSHGVPDEVFVWSGSKEVLEVRLPIALVEKMCKIFFHTFYSADGKKNIIRSLDECKMPNQVRDQIDIITGISDFPPLPKRRAMATKHTENNKKNSKQQIESLLSNTIFDPPRIEKSFFSSNSNLNLKGKGAPSSGGTPQFTQAMGRGGNVIVVDLIPTCLNGNFSNTVPPCADHPPAIVDFVFVANTTSNVVNRQYYSVVEADSGNCSLQGDWVHCRGYLSVDYWDGLNVSVTVDFATGGSVGPFYYEFPVVATPPVTPSTILRQYSIPPNYLVDNLTATQCVVEFEEQYYSPADLSLFFDAMGLPPGPPVTVIGPNDPSNPGGEANLDIQYIMGVAPGSPTTFWSIKVNSTVEIDPMLTWLYQIGNTTNPPLVNSLSYGMTESHVDTYLGPGYLARSDVEFKKLALRGITVLIASGDTGAGDLGPPPMSAPTCNTLHADWPSQSPYVTSVGATFITPNDRGICYLPKQKGGINCDNQPLGEVTVSMDSGLFWTSGGGFSNITQVADYQRDFVTAYLKSGIPFPPPNVWNVGGRAYPDVAAVGHNLIVALNGVFIPVDGTSASAPIFAGVITLLNNARLNAGKAPLGFLNPMLYQASRVMPDTFYDVTVGNNRCGAVGWDPLCCEQGYLATVGWDATSGLGTPNFATLLQYVLSLQ